MDTPKKNFTYDGYHGAQLAVPEQNIRERAYEIYVQRGCKGGHAVGDWLTAEAELKELKMKAADLLSTVQSLTEPK